MHPSEKIIGSLKDLSGACDRLKSKGRSLVLTSGCFDLLHGDHLEYVCRAGEMGSLVVGINSDESVKRLKGRAPVRDQDDRAFTMAGFFPVEFVSVFDDDLDLIAAVRPHIYVASPTSTVRIYDDAPRVEMLGRLGARIVEVGSKMTNSTTAIIARISGAER